MERSPLYTRGTHYMVLTSSCSILKGASEQRRIQLSKHEYCRTRTKSRWSETIFGKFRVFIPTVRRRDRPLKFLSDSKRNGKLKITSHFSFLFFSRSFILYPSLTGPPWLFLSPSLLRVTSNGEPTTRSPKGTNGVRVEIGKGSSRPCTLPVVESPSRTTSCVLVYPVACNTW